MSVSLTFFPDVPCLGYWDTKGRSAPVLLILFDRLFPFFLYSLAGNGIKDFLPFFACTYTKRCFAKGPSSGLAMMRGCSIFL